MWQKINNKLYRKFEFASFAEAEQCIVKLLSTAKQLNHHPEICNLYTTVEVWLSTHEKDDTVTELDEKFAQKIDDDYPCENTPPDTKKVSKLPKSIKMFADGGSRGNPGPSASGYVLMTTDNKVVVEKGVYLGITTNNQAEYRAVRYGLEDALQRGAKEVDVYLDSLLIVNQMNGVFKIRNQDLLPIYKDIKKLASQFDKIAFTHVPRALNKLADAEVNKCLDSSLGLEAGKS